MLCGSRRLGCVATSLTYVDSQNRSSDLSLHWTARRTGAGRAQATLRCQNDTSGRVHRRLRLQQRRVYVLLRRSPADLGRQRADLRDQPRRRRRDGHGSTRARRRHFEHRHRLHQLCGSERGSPLPDLQRSNVGRERARVAPATAPPARLPHRSATPASIARPIRAPTSAARTCRSI